jgi:hypothetical protein
MNKTKESVEPPKEQTRVELVSGPACGQTVNWPANHSEMIYPLSGHRAVYQYEGNGKAFCIGFSS